ncbi:MAG: hypothetical protein KGD70_10080 [Candidatus Lokiarchaeota archaeon]|nr:hypothetical protein [Candidatus Lokiarchaeota archaeon]
MAEEGEKKKIFKKHSIVLVIFQVILIALVIILYNLRNTEIGIQNFSMEKLFILVFAFTIMFGIFVTGYLLNGLFNYNIVTTNFVKKINYKVLMTILFIMMIIGAACFLMELSLSGGEISALTWGSFILGLMGIVILGITLFIGIFLIINEIKESL